MGHECRGAWVNGKYVSLDYELCDRDVVKIDRRKGATPHLSWIAEGKVKTHQAQQKIRQYFLAQQRPEIIADTRNLVREKLNLYSDLRVEIRDLLSAFTQAKVLNEQTDEEGLYLAIADGRISVERLIKTIGEIAVKRCLTDEGLSKEFVRDLMKWFADRHKLSFNREDGLFFAVVKRNISVKLLHQAVHELAASVSGLSTISAGIIETSPKDNSVDHSLSFHAAQCCHPLPDDAIVGFVTVGHGLSIHREACPQVLILCKNKSIVPITWEDLAIPKNHMFNSKLFVTLARYDSKVHRKIQDVLLKADTIPREEAVMGSSQMRFIISVKNVKHLRDIQSRLKQVEGVIEVCRQEQPRQTAGASDTGRSMERS